MFRFPEQPELGRSRQPAELESNAMPARGQGHGFAADPSAADFQLAAGLESIAARFENRQDALPFGLESGGQGGMQGFSFFQVEMGSRRHQADPMPSVPVTGGQPGAKLPLSGIRRSRRRSGLSARAAGAQTGDGEQDDATVDPKQN